LTGQSDAVGWLNDSNKNTMRPNVACHATYAGSPGLPKITPDFVDYSRAMPRVHLHIYGRAYEIISTDLFAEKAKAAFIHLLLSILVASIAAYMVFGVWFPYPYNEVSGGRSLFTLIIWVDICCGPLLTMVLYNSAKSRKELTLDLGLIGIIQLGALLYGVYTVMLARPIYMVFEVDRYSVVTLADVLVEEFPTAREEFRTAPIFSGPRLIAAESPAPGSEDYQRTIDLALQGLDISSRPRYWVPYSEKTAEVLRRAKTIEELKNRRPEKKEIIAEAVAATQLPETELAYLPMRIRKSFEWVALINNKTAEVVGYANVDGY
jgi:hypothetical protein